MENKREYPESQIAFLLQTYTANREELMLRVQQRDNYIIQYIASVSALVTAEKIWQLNYKIICSLILLVSVYFGFQIMCSYKIHEDLIDHIKIIEDELDSALEYSRMHEDKNVFWQKYIETQGKTYKHTKTKKSIRKFTIMMFFFIVCLLCCIGIYNF